MTTQTAYQIITVNNVTGREYVMMTSYSWASIWNRANQLAAEFVRNQAFTDKKIDYTINIIER